MTEQTGEPGGPVSKIDPETLVLRGSPRRAVRFRRGTVIAVAALGSTALVGVAWLGLRPPSFRMIAEANDKIEGTAPPDGLANAPQSYGDVPKLGPPLPGDLGRPVLAHERTTMATETGADRAAHYAEAERQRIEAARKAARESAVMMQLSAAGLTPANSDLAATAVPATVADGDDEDTGRIDLDPTKDPNAQQRKANFLRQADSTPDVNPHRIVGAPSPYTLSAGSIIAASLITGINSDLPGLITAQVTENAYDTATGRTLLMPQGTRLVGRCDSVVAFGQSRAFLVWDRILFPDGSSIRIENMPATDASGYAGLSDKIDRHSWQIVKGVALSTLLGVGTELSIGNEESDLVSALRRSAQVSGVRAGDMLVGKTLDIQPTLKVRPGWPLRVVVHKDIVLRPWQAQAGIR